MPLMTPLSGIGQVDVPDESVEQYEAAGWTKVSGGAKKSTGSGGSSGKSSSEKK